MSNSFQGISTSPLNSEIVDLRNSPIYKKPALHLAYDDLSPKQTDSLDIGTQRKFVDAASEANLAGYSLNTLLTVRWDDLPQTDEFQIINAIPNTVEKIRKWLTRHDLPVFYIWVREVSISTGEHWHLGFHLPKKKQKQFATFIGKALGEPPTFKSGLEKEFGEFARGITAAWHLAEDIPKANSRWSGYWLAAYLGKGEPSRRKFRGKLIENNKKPVRGEDCHGVVNPSKYDAEQGQVTGTKSRKKRYDISKELKRRSRGRNAE